MPNNLFDNYIKKFLIQVDQQNDDVLYVSSSYFSVERDVYVVDRALISPSVIQTTQSLQQLQFETSDVYPYKIITPVIDGATVIYSPGVETEPTASQFYYAPVYFERYSPEVIANIDRTFNELLVEPIGEEIEETVGIDIEDAFTGESEVPAPTGTTGTPTNTGTTGTPTNTGNTGTPTPPAPTPTRTPSPIVTVRIDEQYARIQAEANNLIYDDYIHVPTVDGGWAIMSTNPAFTSFVQGYQNGTYNSTLARQGVVLMIRPRKEYLNQLSAAERALIIP
jgi:hypothetical protein